MMNKQGLIIIKYTSTPFLIYKIYKVKLVQFSYNSLVHLGHLTIYNDHIYMLLLHVYLFKTKTRYVHK